MPVTGYGLDITIHTPEEHRLMLPAGLATEKLGLDQNHFGYGSPATTISFEYDTALRRVNDFDIHKSRVYCSVITYEKFRRQLKRGRRGAREIAHVARLLNQDVDTPSEFGEETSARDTVCRVNDRCK